MPREHHLPLTKHDVVDLCAADPRLPAADRPAFRDFCRILQSVFHFEFHTQLEELKRCHAPFDPDTDTVPVHQPTPAEREQMQRGLTEGLTKLLRAANYEEIPRETLAASLRGESLFRVKLAVDFDDFAEMLLFRRGTTEDSVVLREWFGLRRRTITFANFHRVALLVRFREQAWFDAKKRRDLPFTPGATVLKLFRNVPAADLEMLFPNTEVRMKAIDKVLLGVPAAVGGIVVLATKLLGTILLVGALFAFWLGLRDEPVELDQAALVALGVGVVTLGAYVWKQWNRFKTRKIRFLKTLTENLYFKNLDNNAGVFHRLLDDAEEEECKESVLAYWFLLVSPQPLTTPEVDRGVEAWLRERTRRDVDFDVADAAKKLVRLGLVTREGERWTAVPLAKAKSVLDRAWDGYFQFGAASARPSSNA